MTKSIIIQFESDSIIGKLPVNSLFARYRTLNDTIILVSDLTYTEALGPPWEQKFIKNFPRDTTRYELEGATLVLFPLGNRNRMQFTDDTPTVYQRIN